MKKFHASVAIIGIVLASALAWWYQNRTPSNAMMAGATGSSEPSTVARADGGLPNRSDAAGPAGASGGSAGPGQAGAGPVAVEIGKAVSMTIEDDAQAVGTLQARRGVMLRPEVSGRVVRVGFVDGQTIKQGQVLLQLDDALQQAQLRQAQAQADIARTNLQRQRDLVAQNFVSQSAVDQSSAALAVAEAQVALNRAQLTRMRVVAPFDGVVGIANVDPGDYVKDGADLVAIEDVSAMIVDFRLPERYAARVRPGQAVTVAVDAITGQAFAGKVQALDVQLDTNGRSLLVRAAIDNRQRALRSGMFARTRVVFESRANAIVVPEEALVPTGGKQFLIQVVDGPQGKVSQRLEAALGIRVAGKVEVLQGLAAGDTVVTAGQARLLTRDGVPLRIIDLASVGTGSRPARAASGASAAGSSAASRPSSGQGGLSGGVPVLGADPAPQAVKG